MLGAAWPAASVDDPPPGKMDEERVVKEEGEIPTRKPSVTSAAAASTRAEGVERVANEETAMVRGSWRPRAICALSPPGAQVID